MYEINRIEGEEILLRYAEIKREVERALDHSDGEWNAEQIITSAITHPLEFQIFEAKVDGVLKAIASTRVIGYKNFTAFHIITLGGSEIYEDMPGLIQYFEEMVREYEHLDYLEFTGRRGFVKQLTKVGWTERYVTMRKHLKET